MIYILACVLIFSLCELVPSLISHNVILSFVLQFMAVLQHTVSSDALSVAACLVLCLVSVSL